MANDLFQDKRIHWHNSHSRCSYIFNAELEKVFAPEDNIVFNAGYKHIFVYRGEDNLLECFDAKHYNEKI